MSDAPDKSKALAPVELMLDTVEWTKLPIPEGLQPGELYSVGTGKLTIMGKELVVHQLNNGQRIITAESLAKFFDVE